MSIVFVDDINKAAEKMDDKRANVSEINRYMNSLPKNDLQVLKNQKIDSGKDAALTLYKPKSRLANIKFDLQRFTESGKIYNMKESVEKIIKINPEKTANVDNKLLDYSLNMNHVTANGKSQGRDKAIAFQKALGYNAGNVELLKKELNKGLIDNNAVFCGYIPIDNFPKYVVEMNILGVNEKTAKVMTVWVQENEKFRMVNCYVDAR